MGENDIKVELSEQFALKIVNCYNSLCNEKKEYIMSKQLLRSGTSIGANIAESLYAESDDDFVHKLKIAQKEASETRFWLKLLYRSGYLHDSLYAMLNRDCDSILRILTSIIKTMKNKNP
ncbi:MAG: four helix bundle protein [Muribaculaceae bacterium]|nr:four helix bundle protein [Muribaculaceae bacterium]MDE6551671.1 four helix bundle protein [Muribaculaceae bacterium]